MIAYKSIFQKRSRPITSNDFEESKPLKVFSEYNKLVSIEEDIRKWNETIPFLPQDISKLFKSIFESSAVLEVVFDARDDTLTKKAVRFYVTDHLGNRFAKLIFSNGIFLTPKSEISVNEENRGQGLGKKWFCFANELCAMFGHEKMEFRAGDINGGYTWARTGAYIDLSPQKQAHSNFLREKIIRRIDAVRSFVSNDVYRHARALGRVVAKDDLTRIANIDYSLSSDACHQMEAWDSPFLDSLSAAFNRCGIDVQNEEQRHAEKCVMAARVQGVPLKIGRYLLTRTVYDAYVDFNDVRQMERVGHYVGGWKTIKPVDKKTPVITPALIHS